MSNYSKNVSLIIWISPTWISLKWSAVWEFPDPKLIVGWMVYISSHVAVHLSMQDIHLWKLQHGTRKWDLQVQNVLFQGSVFRFIVQSILYMAICSRDSYASICLMVEQKHIFPELQCTIVETWKTQCGMMIASKGQRVTTSVSPKKDTPIVTVLDAGLHTVEIITPFHKNQIPSTNRRTRAKWFAEASSLFKRSFQVEVQEVMASVCKSRSSEFLFNKIRTI